MEDGIEQHMSIMTNYIVTIKNEKNKEAMRKQDRVPEQILEKEEKEEKEAKPHQKTKCTKEKQD
jgi:hypothetical protein